MPHQSSTAVYATESIRYDTDRGLDEFARRIARADPATIAATEQRGLEVALIKDLATHLSLSTHRLKNIIGVNEARSPSKSKLLSQEQSIAALNLVRLVLLAKKIVANSTAPEAKGFDAGAWLGEWLDFEQLALGGRKPADLVATQDGYRAIARVLGAIESGAYQ